MKRQRKRKTRSFFDLTPEERDREVARFDKPIDIRKDTRPLTKKERALFERMQADQPGVSIRIHNGRTDVVINLDDELLARAKAFARKNKTSLPRMIDRGLRGLLAFGASS